jgi:hypothetical protein
MSPGGTGCHPVRSRVSTLQAAFRKAAEAHLTGPAPAG